MAKKKVKREAVKEVPQKMGRPSVFREEFLEIAFSMAQSGSTDFEIATELGIGVSTLYSLQQRHPEFREALRMGKDTCDDRIERTLYHRAAGYSYPSVKILQDKGQPVLVPYTEHVPPDVGAAKMWLTNRRGQDWRDRQDIAHSGLPEQQETIDVVQLAKMILFGLRLAVKEKEREVPPDSRST